MFQGQRKKCPCKILMESQSYETKTEPETKKSKVFMMGKTISAFRTTHRYNPEDKIKC